MKTLSIKYFNEDEQSYCEYQYQYPTNQNLLEIFSEEAATMIPEKIKHWERVKRVIVRIETKPFLELVNQLKDAGHRDFWKQVYAHMAGSFNKICEHLQRLRLLQSMLNRPEIHIDWAKNKEIAKATPITELYSFNKLRRVGRQFKACCPFPDHDDRTPSFIIYENNTFFCWGCGAGGDAITFLRKLRGYTFSEAINQLSGGVR